MILSTPSTISRSVNVKILVKAAVVKICSISGLVLFVFMAKLGFFVVSAKFKDDKRKVSSSIQV
jgi:cytochrome c-type biogenesis protein CcmE